MSAQEALESLLQQGLVWRGGEHAAAPARGYLPSGFARLDAVAGGWPAAALTELISDAGLGLSLLLPLMARLAEGERWLVLVDPPWRLHAPALAARGVAPERLLQVHAGDAARAAWAMEQLLRAGTCALVLGWPDGLPAGQLRRLQLAAGEGGCPAVLFRPPAAARSPSPAALRLRLQARPAGLAVEVLKRRHGRAGGRVLIPRARL